jgi:hypothetical protein
MTIPSLSQPWVLIRNGKAPPALAYLTHERTLGPGFRCDLMVAEINSNTGVPVWRKQRLSERAITDYDILYVFPGKPNRYDVAEARLRLRRKQRALEGSASR